MKNKLDYINTQVCQREELSKKEDRVAKKGCMNTNTFRKVLLYIEKEKVLKRMDFVRRVWSQGMGVNFVQKEYFNTNYKTGGTVFKKTILNDYKPFCNKWRQFNASKANEI